MDYMTPTMSFVSEGLKLYIWIETECFYKATLKRFMKTRKMIYIGSRELQPLK